MKKLSKNKIITLVLTAVLIIVAVIGVNIIQNQPQDLGPELEYIGKRHTGCPLPLPLGYIMLCSSEPGEEYYFATDLSNEELKTYFKNAHFVEQLTPTRGTAPDYNYEYVEFKNSAGSFTFFYYDNTTNVRSAFKLKPSVKTHIVSIDEKGLSIARKPFEE